MKLLGMLHEDNVGKNSFIVDYILSQARLFIHRCKLKDRDVYFIEFLNYLKTRMCFEKNLNKLNCNKFKNLEKIESLL